MLLKVTPENVPRFLPLILSEEPQFGVPNLHPTRLLNYELSMKKTKMPLVSPKLNSDVCDPLIAWVSVPMSQLACPALVVLATLSRPFCPTLFLCLRLRQPLCLTSRKA